MVVGKCGNSQATTPHGLHGFFRPQIRKFSGLGKDNKFQTTTEYPEPAWYEAIVNACVHRSYHLSNMNIFVKMFDDRLEIDSLGPFPPPVTPENIYDIQHSRNPFLMEAMHYLDFVKCANEGARRMRATMLEMNLPAPEFSQVEVGGAKVRVVLRNNIANRKMWVDEDVAAVIGAKIASSLTENEKEVLNFVAVHEKINISEAQRLTGHNWGTSRKLLKRLEQKGILKYVHRQGVKVDVQAHYVLRVEGEDASSKKGQKKVAKPAETQEQKEGSSKQVPETMRQAAIRLLTQLDKEGVLNGGIGVDLKRMTLILYPTAGTPLPAELGLVDGKWDGFPVEVVTLGTPGPRKKNR
jgi:DNA-binding MarR family transcriptional regulator